MMEDIVDLKDARSTLIRNPNVVSKITVLSPLDETLRFMIFDELVNYRNLRTVNYTVLLSNGYINNQIAELCHKLPNLENGKFSIMVYSYSDLTDLFDISFPLFISLRGVSLLGCKFTFQIWLSEQFRRKRGSEESDETRVLSELIFDKGMLRDKIGISSSHESIIKAMTNSHCLKGVMINSNEYWDFRLKNTNCVELALQGINPTTLKNVVKKIPYVKIYPDSNFRTFSQEQRLVVDTLSSIKSKKLKYLIFPLPISSVEVILSNFPNLCQIGIHLTQDRLEDLECLIEEHPDLSFDIFSYEHVFDKIEILTKKIDAILYDIPSMLAESSGQYLSCFGSS